MITIYKATIDRARGKLSILRCALFNVGCAHSNICAQDKEILVISSDLGLTQVQQSYTWNIHLTISCFLVASSFWAVAAKGPLTYVFIAMDHFLYTSNTDQVRSTKNVKLVRIDIAPMEKAVCLY